MPLKVGSIKDYCEIQGIDHPVEMLEILDVIQAVDQQYLESFEESA